MVQVNNKSYYLEQTFPVQTCCSDHLNLVVIDANGNEILRKNITSMSWLEGCKLVVTKSKKLLALGHSVAPGCDLIYDESIICEFDTLGVITWSLTLNFIIHDIAANVDNDDYFVSSKSNIYKYSGTVLINSFATGANSILSIVSLKNDHVVLSYSTTTGYFLRICDKSGVIKKQVNAGTPLYDLQCVDSTFIYARATGELQKRDDSLSPLYHTLGNLPPGQHVTVYTLHKDSVFAAGRDAGGHPTLFRFDHALNLIRNAVSNVENSIPSGIAVTGSNRINVLTWGLSRTTPGHSFTGNFNTVLSGDLQAKNDVGVTAINVLSSTYSVASIGPLGYINANITVRNFGVDTIRSFHLNHYFVVTGSSYCLGGMLKPFSVTLAPGDTVTVNTGTIYAYPVPVISNTSVPLPPAGYFFCVYTTVPDSSLDNNIQNDEYCLTATLTPLSIEDVLYENPISLNPNPSNGTFVINSPVDITQVDVIDDLGKLVGSHTVAQKKFSPPGKLQPGIYFLKVTVGKRSYIKKAIVSE